MIFSFQADEILHCFVHYNAIVAVFNPDPSGSGSLSRLDAALTNSEVASVFSREKVDRSSVRRDRTLLLETYKRF
jgi:hypothetical protein